MANAIQLLPAPAGVPRSTSNRYVVTCTFCRQSLVRNDEPTDHRDTLILGSPLLDLASSYRMPHTNNKHDDAQSK